jgi:hypothetical protein
MTASLERLRSRNDWFKFVLPMHGEAQEAQNDGPKDFLPLFSYLWGLLDVTNFVVRERGLEDLMARCDLAPLACLGRWSLGASWVGFYTLPPGVNSLWISQRLSVEGKTWAFYEPMQNVSVSSEILSITSLHI